MSKLSQKCHKTSRIIHISHTDIRVDSRILKEISALVREGFDVMAIGANGDNQFGRAGGEYPFVLKTIDLSWSKKLNKNRGFKNFLIVLELLVKVVPMIISANPRVIHCHDTVMLPAAVMAKIFCRASLIYDAHELESDRNGLTAVQKKQCFLWKGFYGRSSTY